jgi:uncharacterized FlaG/YvyC family protein
MEVNSVRPHHAHQVTYAVAPSQRRPFSHDEIVEAVKAVNQTELFGEQNELTFVTDPQLRKPVLQIVDRETKEIVRQIPPEYLLRLARQAKRKS